MGLTRTKTESTILALTAFLMIGALLAIQAQLNTSPRETKTAGEDTREEKIARAMSAGPPEIAKSATMQRPMEACGRTVHRRRSRESRGCWSSRR